MQAPLSSTASGSSTGPVSFTIGTLHAVPTEDFKFQGSTFPLHPLPSSASLLPYATPHRRAFDDGSLAEGAGLAHDAGNLLGALGLYSELLGRPGVLREEHRHYAEELQLLSGRSRELIDRLLNPAATKRQPLPASQLSGDDGRVQRFPPVALSEVIDSCRGLLSSIAKRTIHVAYGAEAQAFVAVPRETLERILVNLTKNAAEASGDEGSIILRVCSRPGRAGAGRVVLTVEDQGCGMSMTAVQQLMSTPGAPPQSAASPVPGAGAAGEQYPRRMRGLGFQVVRELVGASGGQLRLSSGDGCGTTVEIAWSVARDDQPSHRSGPPVSLRTNLAGRGDSLSFNHAGTDAIVGGRQC